ncbi:MAG: prephenate dehydrogenase [Armatimonadetes bacterium]|nr:prephenate dehydrogenase [Armatimonadota bacterium]
MATGFPSSVIFENVAIVGVGLIGGSIGMAARRRGIVKKVTGIGRAEQRLMRAKILGAIDDYSMDMESGAAEADLVILCTPVRLVVPSLARMACSLKRGAIVTDAGSTKQEIVEQADDVMPACTFFVGGHPMAGSEQTGVNSARADLFEGATYVLTPGEKTDLAALSKVGEFATALGAKVEILDPVLHDRAVSVISHLPHAIASALMQLTGESHRHSSKTFQLAAGSFKDLTRIADSSPELWRDISLTNADSLTDAITGLQTILEDLKTALKNKDEQAIESFFEKGRQIREMYIRITQ